MKIAIKKRVLRHKRIRKLIFGTDKKPRLSIFKSNRNIYAQLINDEKQETISSFNSLVLKKENNYEKLKMSGIAKKIGEKIAQIALKNNIKEVVYDRGGFKYAGCIKILAESARISGLKF